MTQNILADVIHGSFQEQSAKLFEAQALNIALRQENARLMQVLADVEAKLKEKETPPGEKDE